MNLSKSARHAALTTMFVLSGLGATFAQNAPAQSASVKNKTEVKTDKEKPVLMVVNGHMVDVSPVYKNNNLNPNHFKIKSLNNDSRNPILLIESTIKGDKATQKFTGVTTLKSATTTGQIDKQILQSLDSNGENTVTIAYSGGNKTDKGYPVSVTLGANKAQTGYTDTIPVESVKASLTDSPTPVKAMSAFKGPG